MKKSIQNCISWKISIKNKDKMKVSYIKDERIHCQHTCATRNAKNYSSRRQMTTDGNTDIQKDSENVQYMGKYKMYHFFPLNFFKRQLTVYGKSNSVFVRFKIYVEVKFLTVAAQNMEWERR